MATHCIPSMKVGLTTTGRNHAPFEEEDGHEYGSGNGANVPAGSAHNNRGEVYEGLGIEPPGWRPGADEEYKDCPADHGGTRRPRRRGSAAPAHSFPRPMLHAHCPAWQQRARPIGDEVIR